MRVALGIASWLLLATACSAPEGEGSRGVGRVLNAITTPHDTIPDFAASPTIRSAQTGPWASPSSWDLGRAPNATDVVLVESGDAITIDDTAAIALVVGVGPGAELRMRADRDTRLAVGTLLVWDGGALEVGTAAAPVAAGSLAEIVIRDVPLDATGDPGQYGTGLLSVNGRVTLHGAPKALTFVRLARAPEAGDTTFDLAAAVSGWSAGDSIIVPDSRQISTESSTGRATYEHLERRTIASVSADGRTATFSQPLAHDHPGTTDENADGQPDYLPHVANLSRNVVVRSENRAGTRGHVLFTHRSAIDVRYTALEGLGRTTFQDLDATTNHIGRYSLHAHHLLGPFPTVDPVYQFRLVGNSIYEDSDTTPEQKWGITVHGSHYGLVQDNVVYNIAGAGIVTEDGSESFNVFEKNFVARITSNGGRDEHFDTGRGIAREGVGFWFRGPNNTVKGNVAANMGEQTGDIEASYGFKYNMIYVGDIHVPNFRGADPHDPAEQTIVGGNELPLLEFSDNEAYGQIQGFTFWWLCSVDTVPSAGCGKTTIQDLTVWHSSRYAFYGYPAYNVTFDRTRVYGDPDHLDTCCEFNSIFWFGDYATKDLLIHDARFYNTVGLTPPYFRDGFIAVENSYFKTKNGVMHRESAAPGSCPTCDLPDPEVVLRSNRFVAPDGHALRTISWSDDQVTDPANVDRLIACDHDQVDGDDFEVFSPDDPSPPCTTTRPDVEGFTCVTPRSQAVCSSPPIGDGGAGDAAPADAGADAGDGAGGAGGDSGGPGAGAGGASAGSSGSAASSGSDAGSSGSAGLGADPGGSGSGDDGGCGCRTPERRAPLPGVLALVGVVGVAGIVRRRRP